MQIRQLDVATPEGQQYLEGLRDRFVETEGDCQDQVAEILAQVRKEGDEAVLRWTRRFDAPDLQAEHLKVTEEEFDQAAAAVDDDFLASLHFAAERIRTFHERELPESWILPQDNGTITGRMVRPVESAGLYVPGGQGGQTPLISSVLMNGIPAVIAGVQQLIMVTPPDEKGQVSPHLLMAAKEVGITEVYKTGSAWAIAALAFGTETIPAVDVIVGPGNQYVAEAKRQVMGRVKIDMIAGPSEVLIVADRSADPAAIAADMLAQAEHDTEARAILLTTEPAHMEAVTKELEKQLVSLERADIARQSLAQYGALFLVADLDQAMDAANAIASEHLELQVEDPWGWLPRIQHAGAVFLGHHTPEAAGDYVAGPNHVLPTMGTARISSALGVETFLKYSSIISCSPQALAQDAPHIMRLAELEGLSAHARSVLPRVAE